MSRCPNCMNELAQERCSRCGYPAVEVVAIRNALPPETLLLERYELGNALASSHQSIAYIAYDCMRRQPVLVLEFFPKQNAVRKKNSVAAKKHQDLFMDACRRFLTSEQAMPMRLLHTFADNNTAYRVYQLAGNAANAVQEADELLDNPILFRDAEGKPVMAVNALPIPPLPHATEWKLSRRLTSERMRKKVNRFAMGALAAIAAAVVGVVVVSMNKTWDVTVRVNTEDAIAAAKLGDVELPAATPGPAGYVEYNATLKRGAYAFSAKSERNMSNQGAVLNVGEENMLEVTIPTPSPTPVVVNVNAGQWAYRIADGKTMMVTEGKDEALINPMEQGQLVTWSLNVKQGRALNGVRASLSRDGYVLPLDLSGGRLTVELTRGEYELILSDTAGTELIRWQVSVADNDATTLDAEPYEYYADKLMGRPEPSSFYYINGGSTPLNSDDVADLSNWAEELPELFADYKQYDVTFVLAEGMPKDVQIIINGTPLTDLSDATFGKGVTTVEVVFTYNNEEIGRETKNIDTTADTRCTLGQSVMEALEARWDGVDGLAKIGESGYISRNGFLALASADEWAKLEADTHMFPAKKEYALCEVKLTVPSQAAGSLADLQFAGVELCMTADEADSEPFELQASPQEWKLTMTLKGETDKLPDYVDVSPDKQDYEISALNDDLDGAIDYSKYRPAGFIRQWSGEIVGFFEEEEPESAEKWLNYAERYAIKGYSGDWTLHPVNVVLDSRVNLECVKGVTLDGRQTELLDEDGVWRLDVSAVTGTEHTIVVTVADESGEETEYSYALLTDGDTHLLKDEAESWEEALQYASVNGSKILRAGDPQFLTAERVEDIKASRCVEIPVTLTGFAADDKVEWKPMIFALRLPGLTDTPEIPIGAAENGSLSFTATAGAYELWVQGNEAYDYEPKQLTTISVGDDVDISINEALATLSSEYRVARNENVRIPIDGRIDIGMGSDFYVNINFAEDIGVYLDVPSRDLDGNCYIVAEGSLPNGTFDITVDVKNKVDAGTVSPLECTYTMKLAGEEPTFTNEDGEKVTALLSDVADEAQANARWWGIEREKLERLPGGEYVWLLTGEAAQANVNPVYLKYPKGADGVNAFTSRDWTFALEVEVDGETRTLKLQDKLYCDDQVDPRYQPLYLSEGMEYRLVITVPAGKDANEFDLGGIVVNVGKADGVETEIVLVETLPGVNDKLMLTEGDKHDDGSPVVELILGYYGANYANFDGVTVTPTSAVTPEPEQDPSVDDAPEQPENNETPEGDGEPTDEGISQTPADSGKADGCEGHTGEWVTTKYATCLTTGMWHWECYDPDCGFVGEDKPISAMGHEWSASRTTEKAATCTAMGKEYQTCENGCGAKKYHDIPATGHGWSTTWTTEKAATCTVAGKETRICQNGCGMTDSRDIAATGHSWSEWENTKKATCKEAGEEARICQNGCETTDTRVIAATGHDYKETLEREATCTMDGNIRVQCAVCSNWYNKPIAKTGHNMVETVQTPATCTVSGVMQIRCANGCGQNETKTIPATGHNEKTVTIREANCTKGGLTKTTCENSGCGYERFNDTDALGHNFVNGKCTRCPAREDSRD